MINFYAAVHVEERNLLTAGIGLRMSPSVSLRNAQRITLGNDVHLGERCCLWAGNSVGRITFGNKVLLGPEVYVTAANYGTRWGTEVMEQPMIENDVVIEDGAWLGVRATVLAGVRIGAGAIIGAGAVVTRAVPEGAVAVGVPARVVAYRDGYLPRESS